MSITFDTSDGWNWNEPIWNQAWVPRRDVPMGEITRSRANTAPPYSIGAKSRMRW